MLIEILTFSFKKMRLKVSSAKRWPFCLGLNVLMKKLDIKILSESNIKSGQWISHISCEQWSQTTVCIMYDNDDGSPTQQISNAKENNHFVWTTC